MKGAPAVRAQAAAAPTGGFGVMDENRGLTPVERKHADGGGHGGSRDCG